MKTANIGSISHGTMRTEDLIPAFFEALQDYSESIYEFENEVESIIENDDYNEDSEYILWEVLAEALQDLSPPYCYFGSHPGDGSDYGFWINWDYIYSEFDGLKVDDTSEVPDDYTGEVLHVNDHGNVTLYACQNGQLTEVWAVV